MGRSYGEKPQTKRLLRQLHRECRAEMLLLPELPATTRTCKSKKPPDRRLLVTHCMDGTHQHSDRAAEPLSVFTPAWSRLRVPHRSALWPVVGVAVIVKVLAVVNAPAGVRL